MGPRIFPHLKSISIMLCTLMVFGVAVIAEETNKFRVFPLPIIDNLPEENRYFHPSWDKCCEKGDGIYGESIVENPYIIKLPNGFNLTVSDWGSNDKIVNNQFPLIENTIFIESRDGVKKAIAAGKGFGDPLLTLVFDNDSKRIYVRESQGITKRWGDLITREYDLKCSNIECFFYQDRDCLLKLKNVDKPSKILKDLEKEAVSNHDDFICNVNNLSIVFLPTLSGKKRKYQPFF